MKKTIEEQFEELKVSVVRLKKEVEKLNDKYRAYNPKYMQEMEGRHTSLSELFHDLIEKLTVTTECSLYARTAKGLTNEERYIILSAVIYAIDLPDEWWNKDTQYLTVKEWVKKCVDEFALFQQNSKSAT